MTKKKTRKKQSTSRSSDFKPNYYRGQANKQKSLSVWNKLLRACLLIAAIAIISSVLYFTKVDSVRVEGIQDQSVKNDIKHQVADNHKFLWQIYTDDSNQTVDYPANIAGIDLKADWRNKVITAEIRTHPPALIWKTGRESYIITEHGFAVSVSDSETEGGDTDSMPIVQDDSNLPIEVGEQVAPKEFVDFATRVVDSGLPVEKLRIIDTTRELYADLDQGYFIRFDTTGSVDSQIDNVRRTQKLAERNNDVIEEYIDVRLQHKAYYR